MADVLMFFGLFGVIGFVAYLKHQRKLIELQILAGKNPSISQNNTSELQDILTQLHELRDTTTRYDMSFDSALQRLEGRMSRMEQIQHQSVGASLGTGNRVE